MAPYETITAVAAVAIGTDAKLTTRNLGLKVVSMYGDKANDGFDCTADRGQIAIQAEGARCEFRKLMLTPL